MHLEQHEMLLGHGVQKAAERIQRDEADLAVLDRFADTSDQFSGRQFGRIDLVS